MSKFMEQVDKETLAAGNRFINRIKSGVLKKRTLPCCFEGYPLDEASESFDAYLKSEQMNILLGRE